MRRAIVVLVLAAGGCMSLDAFMFSPTKVPGYAFPADASSSSRELVQLAAADGVKIWALWLPAGVRPPSGCRRTVLYCHGNAENMEHYYAKAKRIRDLGYDVLLFDYRGFGASEGAPTEEGLALDARAALAEARRRSPAPVVYYGYSLGCAVCTELATAEPPDVLHLDAPFASVDRMVKDNADLPLPGGDLTTLKLDNLEMIPRVAAPVQVFHGTADDFVRTEWGEEVWRRANDPKELWLVPGADHSTIPDHPEYGARLTRFLDNPRGLALPACP